ncbi:sialidase family protein [Sagittula salina]|uniref:Exo-alpha-sialidase n=1 Tax=Sagittula salina TaxID=2820268 RepID=A0A940RZH9_9RHOB|nr:sialidase family protein [Sagittula salina]MBP0481146.1 exo-alpha-sialidase [Sagittula salina]
MSNAVTLLVGTTKGLFVLRREAARSDVSGPHCLGWPINHVLCAGGTLLACGGHAFFGAGVWRSTDGGGTWDLIKLADGNIDEWARNDPAFAATMGITPAKPTPFTGRMDAVWSLGRAGDTLYAGAKPAMLLASTDDGRSWAVVESLTGHPSADSWQPGAAGLTLHTIVSAPSEPGKLWLGISAAGVFASEDGGQSWERRNRLSNAGACGHYHHPAGPKDGETGHCVHNMVRAPGSEDVLYQQNHCGVFRSRDGGRSWKDITAGLPSTFGFPIAVHPQDPDIVWTLPLNGDSLGRFPPDARAAVWRSRDGGDTWEACRAGLPQENCFFTVLRQGMAVDDTAGVYFGTNTGSVFGSFDAGDSWQELAAHLPTVLCVEAVI